MKKIGAALFDLDGTIANTLDDIAASTNHVLAARGLPTYEHEAYRYFVGEGVTRLLARVLPADKQDLATEVAAEFKTVYAEHLLDRTAPYPGIRDLFDQLAARGVAIAVLSNKLDWATQKVVGELFPDVPFSAVVGYSESVPRKPDPTSALAIAERLGVPPPRCALIGDTATDMKTAVAAGMIPVGVLWGFRDDAELAEAGAEHLIAQPAQLLDLVG
jgi:phosphoglycolate phosphatase